MYDIMHPDPIPLRELSAIAVSLEIWRCEVNKYRQNGTLQEFRPKEGDLSSKNILPDLPSVISDLIDEYIERFRVSLLEWLSGYHSGVFHLQYSHVNDVLIDFDDFASDFDGNIHFARTAERIIQCDRFELVVKFATACTYFFENDIRQIWPLVSKCIDVNSDQFSRRVLRYWIYVLTKQFDKIRDNEEMFDSCASHRPAVEYFWNRSCIQSRMRSAVSLSQLNSKCFLRFVLPKLDDVLLDEFVNWKGRNLMRNLVNSFYADERLTLSAWMYIRKVMNEDTFTGLVVDFLKTESYCLRTHSFVIPWTWLDLCHDIWNSAPSNLKRSAITFISSSSKLKLCSLHDDSDLFDCATPDFLLIVLSYATSEERSSFFFNCWRNLTLAYNLENMLKIMEACLENNDEIIQKKIMVECARVRTFWDWD